VGDAAVFVHLEDLGGVDHLTPFLLTALGLDLAELLKRTVEQAGEALLVNADVGEGAALMVESFSEGKGSRGSWFIGADGVELILGGEGEEGGLGGRNAVERQVASPKDWTSCSSSAPLGWNWSTKRRRWRW